MDERMVFDRIKSGQMKWEDFSRWVEGIEKAAYDAGYDNGYDNGYSSGERNGYYGGVSDARFFSENE